MLTEENIFLLSLDVKAKDESDWQKISEAIDNIKIGDLEKRTSLPITFQELIEESPRAFLRFQYYTILLSAKKIGVHATRMERVKISEEIPEEKEIKKAEILQAMQSNFSLLLGVFLGVKAKTTNIFEVNWSIRFKVPLKEHFVQNTTKPSFIEKLKEYDPTSKFTITEIMIAQELSEDERFTYEILEKLEEGSYYIEITKNFKSPPATIELPKLVQDSIEIGNKIVNLVRG